MKCQILTLLVVVVQSLSPDRQDYEEMETSRSLTHDLLELDLGYNVLNNEALRRSLGFSVESLEDTASEDEVIIASATGRQIESLPVPEALVTDKDFKVSNGGGDNHNVWSDEKFWGSGPSPFFFPNIFAPPRPSAAVVRPFRGHLPIQSQHPPHPLHSSHPPRQKTSPAHPKFFDRDRRPAIDYGPVRNDPRCGLNAASRSVAQRRIVGGSEAGFGSFPWQAYIRIGTSRCGGSLVNEWYVITAGHCVARARPNQVRITLGEYVLKSNAEPLPGRTYGASAIKVHPYFKFTPQADRFDVAVVRLNRRVDMAPHISPLCLPPKGMNMGGIHGWASGWGALQPGSRLRPKTLQVVDVPMIENRECERWHRDKGINVIIYDEMICAGYYGGGKDSCQGDSGGPLMTEIEGRWTLIGIVSAGYSCAKRGQPGIYHRVAQTSDWISYSIND